MIRDDFGVLIVSHGRANNVKTVNTIVNRCNYTGKWFIVLDNLDNSIDEYIKNYGQEHIIVFDKELKAQECDTCDVYDRPKNVVLFARNACVDIAKDLKLKYFLELDDDYTEFRSRVWDGEKLSSIYVKDFDSICNEVIEFMDISKALCVAFSQTGDFIGGKGSKVFKERLTRKAMNAFFCTTERPFDFIGRMNDDVNTYCLLGSQGQLFFTIADIALNQPDTQTSGGGLTDAYVDNGTYVKSFFSVMINPSSVKIAEMGCNHRRVHHLVDWEHCVPKIISDKYKK